jgi:hypothetical protein
MGRGGIRCGFKGETDAIITREGSPLFGRVCRVLGYTMHSHVILHVQGEPERKLVSCLDAALLNVGGVWPLLSKARPKLGSHVLVLKGQCGGIMGHVTRLEPRRSTLCLMLDVVK